MPWRTSTFAFFAIAVVACSGCEIVQGFRDASDALFPPERTYFDAPGFRLTPGGYRTLDYTAGTDLYLLARSWNKEDPSLYSMRYASPQPCAIPHVGSFRGTMGTFNGRPLVAYQEKDAQGVLRFADGECKTLPFTVNTIELPSVELTDGLIVSVRKTDDQSSAALVLVNPVTDALHVIVGSAMEVMDAFGGLHVIRVETNPIQLAVFRPDWHEIRRFGQNVGPRLVSFDGVFYYEDDDGVHRLTSSGGSSPEITDRLIARGACGLAAPPHLGGSDAWITFRASCGAVDVPLNAYTDSMAAPVQLPIPADVYDVALWPVWPATRGDPTVDPFLFFYIQGEDGSLWMQSGSADPVRLGSTGALDRITLVATDKGVFGYTLVESDGSKGRFIRFGADGSTQVLAENVRSSGSDLILNPDDPIEHAGDFALPAPSGVQLVAKGVPYGYFRLRDPQSRWTAVFSDLDASGSVATLSITKSSLDFGTAAAATDPSPPPVLTPIAYGVRPDWRTQFVPAVPGIAYLTNYDAQHNTGRLDYRNLELEFTATVSEGVSAYVVSTDSLIYTVPFGDAAGIWAVRAR